jgi:hypothetical protein
VTAGLYLIESQRGREKLCGGTDESLQSIAIQSIKDKALTRAIHIIIFSHKKKQ